MHMKIFSLCLLLVFFALPAYAQSEVVEIKETIQRYIDGTSTNDPELILSAFYEDADLFLSKEGQEIFLMSIKEYAGGFNRGERGQPNGRVGHVLSVDQSNDIALAKAEIAIPASNLKFIDVFILKRLSGEWKIISKAATRIE